MGGKIDNSTIIVVYFNTALTILNKTARQKISKETEDLTL